MPFYERPNLKAKMVDAAQCEKNIKDAQSQSPSVSKYEKKIMKRVTWERRLSEKSYFSQSGQGSPPWEKKLQLWALVIGVVGMVIVALLAAS